MRGESFAWFPPKQSKGWQKGAPECANVHLSRVKIRHTIPLRLIARIIIDNKSIYDTKNRLKPAGMQLIFH